MGYVHLNIDERESILKMQSEGKILSEIAEYLGRDKGTISRELSRNISSTGEYKPHLAQRYYSKRRIESKQPYRLEQNGRLRRHVRKKLKQYHSPEQIAGRLEIDHPDAPQMRVSPLTVYSWVRRDKADGGDLYECLRQGHRKRRKKSGSDDKRHSVCGYFFCLNWRCHIMQAGSAYLVAVFSTENCLKHPQTPPFAKFVKICA